MGFVDRRHLLARGEYLAGRQQTLMRLNKKGNPKRKFLSLALISALVIGACGGGRSSGGPIPTLQTNDDWFADHIADPRIYPVGQRMAVGLYSSDVDFTALSANGWNLFHTYTDSERLKLAAEAKVAGVGMLGTLTNQLVLPSSGSLTADETQAYQNLQQTGAVTWWDLPEERAYWIPEQMGLVIAYANLVRSVNMPLPTYMYIPSNYDASDVSNYMPYVDIVPAAVYPSYANQPYAWTRWRMETTIAGISAGKSIVGKNYLAGQKTPVAVLELFAPTGSTNHPASAAGAYHDFWQVLVSGAQGILIYSYYHRNDDPVRQAIWGSYQKAMGELLGADHLDCVLLWGTPVSGVKATEIGSTTTLTFQPIPEKPNVSVSYSAVDLTARQVGAIVYVVAVNSAETSVKVKITGFSNKASSADLLFRNQSLSVSNGGVDLEMEALGVYILKVQS